MIGDDMIDKIKFFFKKKVTVHISCFSGQFYNGVITAMDDKKFLIINDRMFGETPVYFSEIKTVEKFKEAGRWIA